jgi:hypothetical protein
VVSFFVYYRVVPERAPFARNQIQRLQDRLAAATGIRGRLMTKCDEPNLWMEVYEQVPAPGDFEREAESLPVGSTSVTMVRRSRSWSLAIKRPRLYRVSTCRGHPPDP